MSAQRISSVVKSSNVARPTVAELIAALQRLPQDVPVAVSDDEHGNYFVPFAVTYDARGDTPVVFFTGWHVSSEEREAITVEASP